MAEYICGVVGAALIISVILLVLPEDAAASREVKLLGSLALLCVIVAPLGEGVRKVTELVRSGELTVPEMAQDTAYGELASALERQSASEINAALRERICSQFGLYEDDVEVSVQVGVAGGEVRILRVYVIFGGRAMWQDPHPVIEYVEELCGVPCEVAQG